ncbi:MAG: MBL fold metallo-hydrolase [Cyanobacteriota bacterium]
MRLTYLDSNSWLIEIAGKQILLDPRLVGDLVFGNLPWFFKGQKQTPHPIPDKIDLILLSQGLEDHAHIPTLKELDCNIPVVASPNAAKVVKELGYTQITTLNHGETFTLDSLEIKAVPGSPIGPFLTENGYVLKGEDTTLYYEPHGYHDPSLKEVAPIDVVITPLVSIKIPVLGPVIQGWDTALDAAKLLQPKVMIPTAAGGDVTFDGILNSVLKTEGSIEAFRETLAKNNLSIEVIEPKSWEAFEVQLAKV